MPSNQKPTALANPKRFKTIQDLTKMRPDCGASIDDIFVVDKDLLIIIDTAYLSGILNPYNSPSASYVRTHGVFVQSYNRTESCPVFWRDPFMLLPLSHHLNDNLRSYTDNGEVVGSVSCPTGSLLLLPFREDIPLPLGSLMDEALASEGGVKIKLPNGTYRVFYEQFEAPEGSKKNFYQNIVIQRQ